MCSFKTKMPATNTLRNYKTKQYARKIPSDISPHRLPVRARSVDHDLAMTALLTNTTSHKYEANM